MFNEAISEIKGEQLILGLFLMHILLSGVLFLTTMSEPRVKDDAQCHTGLLMEEKLKGIVNIYSAVNMNLLKIKTYF